MPRYERIHDKGFTLIELMLVMIITGVLILIGITTFQSTQIKSRDLRRKSDLKQIANALELYYNDKGRYPKSTTDGLGKISGCGSNDAQLCDWNKPFLDSQGTYYMEYIPDDRVIGRKYYYYSNQTYFQLYARLENYDDNDIVKDASEEPSSYGETNCSTGTPFDCNFGVSSSNTTPESGRTIL